MRLVDYFRMTERAHGARDAKADARIDELGLRERLGTPADGKRSWRLTGRLWAVGNRPTEGFYPTAGVNGTPETQFPELFC